MSKIHDEPLKRSSDSQGRTGILMASKWTGTIDVVVTEGYVNYVATNADPVAHGVSEISGIASLYRVLENGSTSRQKFQISLAILGQSTSQAKREVDEGDATWPDVMKNEITDDVIGILFKPDENELRRGYLYLHPDQFDKLIGNLTPSMQIRLYSRQGVQSECDLIVRVDVTTKKFEPQS
jgi:hypothetical protein